MADPETCPKCGALMHEEYDFNCYCWVWVCPNKVCKYEYTVTTKKEEGSDQTQAKTH